MLATELEPGNEIDGYRIEQRLYAGGMAVIYRVSRDDLPGPAVMKVPRLGQGEPGATVVSFEVEQMVLDALDGGPVPRLYGAGDLERSPYLVMALIEGRTLSSMLENGPLAEPEVRRLGAALALAVQQLHEREVIHLDLKPSNVMIRPDGSAVLIDLGLARHAHLPDLLAEEFRRPLGSAPYISPEQVLGIRHEARSDVFALGVILYELATGHYPFGAPATPNGMRKRLRASPVPPRARVPALSEALQETIYRCLEVNVEKRLASAKQLAFELQHAEQVEVSARGRWTRRQGVMTRLRKWVFGLGYEPTVVVAPAERASDAPIIMVAVATAYTNEKHQQAIRLAVQRFAAAMPAARVACVTVTRPQPVMGTADEASSAPRQHLQLLVKLRHWAEPIALPAGRITFHVLEAGDPSDGLLDYARNNQVDHILIGAPPPNLVGRNILPPVADRVINDAPCSVTIVRPRS
ncbi:bifunctional serine/threonine-protein kinase/universal stress protein [Niveibacterium sp. 24ML]|uniref:serine/threonine protein kinase n=1 Tax=Niveibacterium sp. 24ML TaxID=2985512 RepID=UPI0022702704|nr:bifunctional serine/threonine-protein kinase/universal stress protein [Niveibacterium sp. 24ML]MCX9154626.1 bifunctional serine/threonine-protein kinase/universal stress protein [Niveibacterium sp. 24ML]